MTLFQQKRATDQDIIIPLGNGNGKRKQEKNMPMRNDDYFLGFTYYYQTIDRAHYHIYYT